MANGADRPLRLLDDGELSGAKQNHILNITVLVAAHIQGDHPREAAWSRALGLPRPQFRAGGAVLDLRLGYAYTEANFQDPVQSVTPVPPGVENVSAGRSFALVPRHRVNAGLTYRRWPRLAFEVDARYVSSQFLRGDEANRQAPLPAYWVLDAGVAARWRGLEAFLRVNNLLDNHYETFGTFAPNPRQAGAPVERFLTPAPPINVLAGLQYPF